MSLSAVVFSESLTTSLSIRKISFFAGSMKNLTDSMIVIEKSLSGHKRPRRSTTTTIKKLEARERPRLNKSRRLPLLSKPLLNLPRLATCYPNLPINTLKKLWRTSLETSVFSLCSIFCLKTSSKWDTPSANNVAVAKNLQ
jgi:hypothetical protein